MADSPAADARRERRKRRAERARAVRTRRRMTTAFGWTAGGTLGLLSNYAVFVMIGRSYPVVPTTFVAFVSGCFGGMYLADRWGVRGFHPLGLAAGTLLVALGVLVALLIASR